MKIDVYDSYAQSNRRLMHFDVFVKSGVSAEQALEYGRKWLEIIGEDASALQNSRCNFCHSELANPEVARLTEVSGHYILQMEGCLAPY